MKKGTRNNIILWSTISVVILFLGLPMIMFDRYEDTRDVVERSPARQQVAGYNDKPIAAQIRELLSSGAIHSINVEFNQVRIAPELWRALPIESKQGFVYQFSKYFDSKGSTGRVTVLSNRSDKKLATYGSWQGMRILE